MKKKLYALFLTLAMVVTYMPAIAFADSENIEITAVKYSGGENGKIRDAGYSGGVKGVELGDEISVDVNDNGTTASYTYTLSNVYNSNWEEYEDRWICSDPNAPKISYAAMEASSDYASLPFNAEVNYRVLVWFGGLDIEAYSGWYKAKKNTMDWDNNVNHIGYSVRTWADSSTVVLYSSDRNALASTTDIDIPEKARLADGRDYTVTSINRYALGGLKNLKSITIPETVTEIEDYAFGYTVGNWKQEGDYDTGFTWVAVDAVKNESLIVYGKAGTVAETYARENGFIFAESECGHTHNLTHVSARAATCGADGNIEYWTCSGCGKYFSDAEGNNEISAAGTVIKATGDHSYSAWTTTKSATETAAGQQMRTCSKCAAVQTQAIAQLTPTLPKVKIAKPAAAKKAVTVKWKKVSKTNLKKIKKVEVQVSTTSNFSTIAKTKQVSAKKKSVKIKGLKSKQKYYVRVRAYTSGHVSAWSAVKSVKTK